MATAIALSVWGLFASSARAFVNEKPIVDKQYNEFLYYDAAGSKNFSLQGSEKGVKHNYYFNEGATLDASNGGIHAAVLAHNWGEFDTETAEIFHVGDGKEFTVKSYSGGMGTFNVEEGATLEILGGNISLEAGIQSTNSMENTESSIHMESSGKIVIDAESMWMGNKRTEDRHNVGAISLILDKYMEGTGNSIAISLQKGFSAENVDTGIAVQTEKSESTSFATINAKNDVVIHAFRSDGDKASGYRGAGIYALSYHVEDAESRVNLISSGGNIDITAQGYAVYTYGNTPVTLSAENGSISLHSEEKQGIYAKGYFEQNSNIVHLAGKEISVVGTYGIRADNAVIGLNNGQKSSENVFIKGDKYGVYLANDAITEVNADALTLSTNSEGWSVVSFSGSRFSANVGGLAKLNDSVYTEDGQIDVDAASIIVTNDVRALSDIEENGTGGTGFSLTFSTELSKLRVQGPRFPLTQTPSRNPVPWPFRDLLMRTTGAPSKSVEEQDQS